MSIRKNFCLFGIWLCSIIAGAAAEAAPSQPATSQDKVHLLRQILISDNAENALKLEVEPARGFVLVTPPLSGIDASDLKKRLAAGENQPIDDRLLAGIAKVVEVYFRQHGYPTATAVIPPQNIAAGGVRVVMSLVNYPLKQIVIGESIEAAHSLTPSKPNEFVTLSPALSFLDSADLRKRLEAGRGRLVDETLIAAIKEVIENFVHSNDLPAAAVTIPNQDLSAGIVRVAVAVGKIRNIQIQGNRWFSDSLLREKLRIDRGSTVRLSELDRAITWTNASPFRRVKVHVDPVPDTGEADVTIGVTEEFPLRATFGYENTGNAILGEDRYVASIAYGNVWGRDHTASYQFATGNDIDVLQVHALDYRAPLPWRHFASLSASYVKIAPTFEHGLFTQKGRNINADGKYTIPFETKRWKGELSAGLSYKQTNNNLEFGGAPASFDTLDLFTGSLSVAGMREDQRGRWIASATLTGSPSNFNSRNDRDSFYEARIGAQPRFAYGQFFLQRNTLLTPNDTSVARAVAQVASTNLVPSEQFGVGGVSTVRGYEERIISGDGGYTFTHELHHRMPAIPLGKHLPKLDWTGVFFWDYGQIYIKHPLTYIDQTGAIVGHEAKSAYLASAGLGLRIAIGSYLSGSIDAARQLEDVETPGAAHHRVHVKFTLAY